MQNLQLAGRRTEAATREQLQGLWKTMDILFSAWKYRRVLVGLMLVHPDPPMASQKFLETKAERWSAVAPTALQAGPAAAMATCIVRQRGPKPGIGFSSRCPWGGGSQSPGQTLVP